MKPKQKRQSFGPKYQPGGYKWLSITQRDQVASFIREAVAAENTIDLKTTHDLGLSTLLAERGIPLTTAAVAYYRGVVLGIPSAMTRLRLLIQKRGASK